MEDWEEGSDVESCRSSVISDLDELEANLYGIIHHEVNEEVNESLSNTLSVLPVNVGDGFWRTKEDVSDIAEKNLNSDKNEVFREGNERCNGQKEKEVHLLEGRGRTEEKEEDQSCVIGDLSESSEQNLSVEYVDSRYNVGGTKTYSKEKVAVTSPNITTSKSRLSTSSKEEDNSPIVIDVLSSEEELEVNPVNTVSQSKKQNLEEVVVLDDSDSDVMIEMEKVNVRQSKKKKYSEFSEDIQLNTVKSGKVGRYDVASNPHVIESVDIQSNSPTANISSIPMKELDLSTICKNWTPEMINFYEESWGGENWTLNEVLASMSDHGWDLDVTDQFSILPGRAQDRRYFGNSKAWCTNCNRRGHTRNECQEEIRRSNCRRCGSTYHSEYNCQEKLCLSCGKETKYFTRACHSCRSCLDKGTKCSICSVKGHLSKFCPDLWRRYHATIVPGRVVCPKKVLYKSSMNLYCCNCATKGHHVFQCKKKTFSDYIPHSPKVIKYENTSSPSREKERQDISENWEKRRIAHESKIKETPKNRRNYLDESGSRCRDPKENGISRNLKPVKSRTPLEFNDSALSVSTVVKPSNPKKKKLKKAKKILLKEKDMDLNVSKNPPIEQATVKTEPGSSVNVNQDEPTNNCVDQYLSKQSCKMILTKKRYQMLKGKEGEEVLKYISKTEPGTAVTLLHTDVKMLIFIGNKASVTRARSLMSEILTDQEAWKRVTDNLAENDNLGSKKRKKKKAPKVRATSVPNQPKDLREEINQNLSASRDVKCLPISGADCSKAPANNKVKRTPKLVNKLRNLSSLPPKEDEKTVDPQVKSSIQAAVRSLLKGKEEVTSAQVRSFANWALRDYGKVVNPSMRRRLGILTSSYDNNGSTKLLRKNLLHILKWEGCKVR